MADRLVVCTGPCHHRRIAAQDNVWRYRTPSLWSDIFGGMPLVRERGRIGQDGTVKR